MKLDLSGKVVLITGAARRVGAETACTLHRAGASVIVHYRSATDEASAMVQAFEAERPGSALALQADLLVTSDLAPLVQKAVARFGGLDALVNNASSFHATPLGQIGESDWDDLMGSNLKAPLFLTQAAAPYLKSRHGAVVNIIDIHAERPLKDYPLYCAAKAGLLGLTRALALELAPEVRVNGISPGAILWPEDDSFSPEERQRVLSRTPLGREGTPTDIARTVLFLLAGAPYVTGQVLAVDGGRQFHL
ncbi:MAG: pteridine reductase [Rhodocyclaceae bacterium]|nr:pteridine reductase [Rhodocyclaceae bacterium]